MSIDQQIINGKLFILSFESSIEADGLHLWKKMQEGAFSPIGEKFMPSKYYRFLPSMRIKEPLPKIFYRTSTLIRTINLLRKENPKIYNDCQISIQEKIKFAVQQMPSNRSFLEEQIAVYPLVINHMDSSKAQIETLSFSKSLKDLSSLMWTDGGEIKNPYIKSFLYTLMSIGAIDLACLPFSHNMKSPLDAIKAYRLNKFGRYIFSYQDEYLPETKTDEKDIELDEHNLIMHIDERMDSRVSTISCMSERILPSYYKFSKEHIADGCRNTKEMIRRINYLKENFGNMMPANWQAFLEETERNAVAIKPISVEGYHIFSFDHNNPDIVKAIKACRDFIICTNHNLFLIESAHYPKFLKRMRENGIPL